MTHIRIERHGANDVYVLEDTASGSSARVLPGYGFNCYSFGGRTGDQSIELLRSSKDFAERPERASGNGTPVLFPFPNRIRGGAFEFEGRSFQLPCNERGVNAIHGLVLERPWRVAVSRERGSITGRFQLSVDAPDLRQFWPADFIIELSYELQGNRLTSQVRISNPDTRPLPWGFGTHPYFRLPLASGDESSCSVIAPVGAIWELHELLPTGRRIQAAPNSGLDGSRPYSELKFDDVFTKLRFQDGWCNCRMIDRAAGLALRFQFSDMFRELVIYTPPDRRAICLEPYSCVTDAINLQRRGVDAGLGVLQPKGVVQGTMVLELESLRE